MKRDIRTKSGTALLDFILADIQELKRLLFDPQSHQVIMAAMEATWWLNELFEAWLGEKNAADTLTQSAPHNVTSEMGLRQPLPAPGPRQKEGSRRTSATADIGAAATTRYLRSSDGSVSGTHRVELN